MKIKTFYQYNNESPEEFDAKVNQFIQLVRVLDIISSSASGGGSDCLVPRSTLTVVYEEKNYFNDYLGSKKYWGTECKLRQKYSLHS